MSILDLALLFISEYCGKHDTCASCRMYSRHKGCMVQQGVPPSLWDVSKMTKGESKNA